MNIQSENEAWKDYCSSTTEELCFFQNSTNLKHLEDKAKTLVLSRDERLKHAIEQMRLGERIHEEVKRQGRSVTWLASQLSLERCSLYYTFRQNSIDMELLLRISSILNHNFIQDIAHVYESCGL